MYCFIQFFGFGSIFCCCLTIPMKFFSFWKNACLTKNALLKEKEEKRGNFLFWWQIFSFFCLLKYTDEDNEESQSKDRQSLVIPEKSSSFSIHPGRCCGDVCCYCFGKFGSLDTPMHLAQMKSDERRQKILNLERHLTKDSCLCDACYRHIDRKVNFTMFKKRIQI